MARKFEDRPIKQYFIHLVKTQHTGRRNIWSLSADSGYCHVKKKFCTGTSPVYPYCLARYYQQVDVIIIPDVCRNIFCEVKDK